MDVLIVERDELVGSLLVETLEIEGISATVASDEEALMLGDDGPRMVITNMNRGHNEDLRGRALVSAMRRKWPGVGAIYLAALWPAHLPRRALAAGERFLDKPVHLERMIRTVRDLLNAGICRRSK
jgi:DNA-binding response OmpR family regulator